MNPEKEVKQLKKELLEALIRLRNHAAFVTRNTRNSLRAFKDVERSGSVCKHRYYGVPGPFCNACSNAPYDGEWFLEITDPEKFRWRNNHHKLGKEIK